MSSQVDNLTSKQIPVGVEADAFIEDYVAKGGSVEEAQTVLQNLLELAVIMFRKGDIRTVDQGDKLELVCQVKKGSRRLALQRQ